MYLEQKYLLLVSSQLGLFKKKSNNLYNFRCPYCGDSQKSKSKARGYVFQKENSLIYKCHNCGVGTTVPKLIRHVNETLYNEFMTESYRAEIPQDTARGIRIDKDDLSTSVKNMLKTSTSKLRSLKKVSQLDHNHPVKKFVEDRKIPSDKHYLLYYSPHFYKFVNTIVDNKFIVFEYTVSFSRILFLIFLCETSNLNAFCSLFNIMHSKNICSIF